MFTKKEFGWVCLVMMMLGSMTIRPAEAQQTKKNSGGKESSSNTFISSQGFSLAYPVGWMVASKDQSATVAEKSRPYLQKLGIKDLSSLALLVFSTENKGFVANLNINIVTQAIEVSESQKPMIRATLAQIEKALGTPLNDVRISIEPISGKQAFVVRYNFAARGFQIAQLQVYIPNKDKTYIVTSSAAKDEMPRYEPTFKKMVDSIRFK